MNKKYIQCNRMLQYNVMVEWFNMWKGRENV
jgi:hypothetical protein